MPSLFENDDFEAEQDFISLMRASDIEKDAGRVARAKDFAIAKRDRLDQGLNTLGPSGKGDTFNNSVQNSKMKPKS